MATLQVRDIPEDVRRILKKRATEAGQSLSAYVSAELSKLARRPTVAEFMVRMDRRGPAEVETSATEILRTERAARPG